MKILSFIKLILLDRRVTVYHCATLILMKSYVPTAVILCVTLSQQILAIIMALSQINISLEILAPMVL